MIAAQRREQRRARLDASWGMLVAGVLFLAPLAGCRQESGSASAQAGADVPAGTNAGKPLAESGPAPGRYGRPRQLGRIADKRVSESSGIARSNVRPGGFWTHNDGNTPRLYLISGKGETLAVVKLEGPRFVDCEDIAAFSRNGKHYLLYADTGDNKLARSQYQLHLLEEPVVEGNSRTPQKARVALTIPFRYPDGPHDCEAVAVDAGLSKIYLATKERKHGCLIYQLDLPAEKPPRPLEARFVARLETPLAAAMDISPDGLRAILLTDGGAYEFTRRADESWETAFRGQPSRVAMPPRANGEAICYGADGKALYLTSEGIGEPLWEIPGGY